MGHHVICKPGSPPDFQSDRYPDLGINKIVFSFKDPAARKALYYFISYTADQDLAEDIMTVLTGRKWPEVK